MGRNFHIHWQKQNIFCRRDHEIFRTPWNISDEAFIMKMVNDKKSFLIFPKRLHHRCLIRSYIHLWEIYMTFYKKIYGAVTFLSNASKLLYHMFWLNINFDWKTISDLRVFFVSLYYWNHLTSYICFELFLHKMPLYI